MTDAVISEICSVINSLQTRLLGLYPDLEPWEVILSDRVEAPKSPHVNGGQRPDLPQYFPRGWIEGTDVAVIWLRKDRLPLPGESYDAVVQVDLLHEFSHHIDFLKRGHSPGDTHGLPWLETYRQLIERVRPWVENDVICRSLADAANFEAAPDTVI